MTIYARSDDLVAMGDYSGDMTVTVYGVLKDNQMHELFATCYYGPSDGEVGYVHDLTNHQVEIIERAEVIDAWLNDEGDEEDHTITFCQLGDKYPWDEDAVSPEDHYQHALNLEKMDALCQD